MIIIKIIILYFIQIRHTDDFPSTGTRPVHTNWSTFIQLFHRPRRLKYCPETLAYVCAAYNLGLVKLIAGAHNGLTFLF